MSENGQDEQHDLPDVDRLVRDVMSLPEILQIPVPREMLLPIIAMMHLGMKHPSVRKGSLALRQCNDFVRQILLNIDFPKSIKEVILFGQQGVDSSKGD